MVSRFSKHSRVPMIHSTPVPSWSRPGTWNAAVHLLTALECLSQSVWNKSIAHHYNDRSRANRMVFWGETRRWPVCRWRNIAITPTTLTGWPFPRSSCIRVFTTMKQLSTHRSSCCTQPGLASTLREQLWPTKILPTSARTAVQRLQHSWKGWPATTKNRWNWTPRSPAQHAVQSMNPRFRFLRKRLSRPSPLPDGRHFCNKKSPHKTSLPWLSKTFHFWARQQEGTRPHVDPRGHRFTSSQRENREGNQSGQDDQRIVFSTKRPSQSSLEFLGVSDKWFTFCHSFRFFLPAKIAVAAVNPCQPPLATLPLPLRFIQLQDSFNVFGFS